MYIKMKYIQNIVFRHLSNNITADLVPLS